MPTSFDEPRVLPGPTDADDPGGNPRPATFQCDACGRACEGTPGGSGLFVWTRGDEVRYEEPPLCEDCAAEITVGALMRWDVEQEEEG